MDAQMPTENPPRLLALSRVDRADFLLLALHDAALRDACRRLQLTFPGYRLEKVKPVDMADALAEEYETSEQDAAAIEQVVEECCPLPDTIPEDMIPARVSGRLVELLARLAATDPEYAFAPLLWRLFGHPVESVRSAAAAALSHHLDLYDKLAAEANDQGAQAPGEGGPEASPPVEAETPGEAGAEAPDAEDAEPGAPPAAARALRRRIKEAESRAGRLSADVEGIRRQLAAERAQSAQKDERLSRVKRELEQAREELRATGEAKAALEAERDRDTLALLKRRESELEDLKREAGALQRRVEEAHRREAEVLARLRSLEAPQLQAPPAPEETPAPVAERASSYQVPDFTREFYESIEEWDDRILRTTFEKVLLLAKNLAHPSLDAKPIEGADGLYRIKIGTDVRLLYRRKPNRGIEVLSLIDREDLDRYVRQYKKRSHA